MDVNGGQIGNQTNGNPIWPGTLLTGPVLAGNVFHSDGSGNLAGFGEYNGQANVGYVQMAQTGIITQAGNTSSTAIVVPAQSQILAMSAMVTTAWTGANLTFNVGTTGNATFLTATSAASGNALGLISFSPGNLASRIANWDNVGNTDVQLSFPSVNTGNGTATFTVQYVQGIFNAS